LATHPILFLEFNQFPDGARHHKARLKTSGASEVIPCSRQQGDDPEKSVVIHQYLHGPD
jgi:hypothetical protein